MAQVQAKAKTFEIFNLKAWKQDASFAATIADQDAYFSNIDGFLEGLKEATAQALAAEREQ
jgi:hypothetical protein